MSRQIVSRRPASLRRLAPPASKRYRFAPLPSLIALVLIASCASGEEPIEPAVSNGNSALLKADYQAVQAASITTNTGQQVASANAIDGSPPNLANDTVITGAAALASASQVDPATSGDAGKESRGALAVDAQSVAMQVPEQASFSAGAGDATQADAAAVTGASTGVATHGSLETFAADALAAINAARAQARTCGDKAQPAVGPLTWNARVAYAAMLETEWMQSSNSFGHVWPTGERVWDRLLSAGYLWAKADENIAAGFRTLDAAMKAWIDSPPHCVALMRADLTEVGVSVVPGNSDNTYLSYWAMVLASPQAVPAR